VNTPFEAITVLRSERPALCPGCKTPKFVFHRLLRGTVCSTCAEAPLPRAIPADLDHPTRKMGLVFRHGKTVLCVGCDKERTVFALASGLCLKCHA
jgi:ribosomal protein S27E